MFRISHDFIVKTYTCQNDEDDARSGYYGNGQRNPSSISAGRYDA